MLKSILSLNGIKELSKSAQSHVFASGLSIVDDIGGDDDSCTNPCDNNCGDTDVDNSTSMFLHC